MHKTYCLSNEIRQAALAALATGRTAAQLARETKMSQAMMSLFLNGKRWLSAQALDRLAAVLGLRLSHNPCAEGLKAFMQRPSPARGRPKSARIRLVLPGQRP